MTSHGRARALALLIGLLAPGAARAQAAPPARPDLTRDPTLYLVGYAHLDTQWRWEYPQVISEFIPNTMRQNFALFAKYPHYVFNFSGANRYRMMKEYHPADYAKVKAYVAAGRWFPSGSSMEENDVNVPSAESLLRQLLYGSEFFRQEFGTTSAEYMLPDCFGFPASLPSVLAHAGIIGFSTQKLTWHSAAGIPFNVGVWEGPDGRSVIAALNPGSYGSRVQEDLSRSPEWSARVKEDGDRNGLFADYHYYGVGDRGGSPQDSSVLWAERSVTGDGPLHVVSSTAEQLFLDITPAERARLPRYKGDLLLIEHSAGSISSQAYLKRWNHANELLADAAERASVAAGWLGGRPYPLARLNDAWTLVMGGQFHDILPGTSTPKAYEYSWNDEVLALNQFAGVLTDAATVVAAGLNTESRGTAIVVYNPLSVAREDVVEATVTFPGGAPAAVRVTGPDGGDVPAQVAAPGAGADGVKVLFLAKVPSVGFAVYDVQPAPLPAPAAASPLAVTDSTLENARYRVRLDGTGDLASVFDKRLGRELLAAPARLALQHEKPTQWPAWNMDWADQRQPPRGYVAGAARVRIVERGPARVALEITRETEGSRFVQTVRLAAGDAGNRIEIANAIDWKIAETALKATFPLTAANPLATYNWEIGTIERGNNDSTKYEVPSHQWIDLTDRSGAYGVTLLTGHKYGSDKPDDRTLRLTLIYTPGISGSYEDQGTQDWGHHELVYGLASHAGDWRQEHTNWEALRLDQPLIAFQSPGHRGALGRSFSLLGVSTDQVRVLALKRAERSDELIVRLVEQEGRPAADVRIAFAAPVTAARAVDGREMPVGGATIVDDTLVASFTRYQPRSFAVRLGFPVTGVAAPKSQAVTLPYDRRVTSADGARSDGGFGADGQALPAEMLPREIAYAGITFALADSGAANAVVARGQTVALPKGKFTRLYVLAASADGDRQVTFRVGDTAATLTVQDWGGYIGQWDNRLWKQVEVPPPPEPAAGDSSQAAQRARRILARIRERGPITRAEYAGLVPGYIKRAPVAWFASHRHTADGANEPYAYAYLFAYAIDLPAGAQALTLPNDDRVRVLAVTVSNEQETVRAAAPLYDTLSR